MDALIKEPATPSGAGHRLGDADAIYINGNIITADDEFSIAQAVAVRDERFLAVGSNVDIKALAGPRTQTVDLAGQTVIPGLIDTHAHVEYAGLLNATVQFDGARNAAEALERISAHAERVPHGKWVLGSPWHPVSQLAEKRFLTREELDRVAPHHPVYLTVGHFAMLNSRALDLAGITKDTPDPDGGMIHRDPETGEPNGTLEESAEELVRRLVPKRTSEDFDTQIKDSMTFFNRYGITSAISAAVNPATLRAHQRVRMRGDATLRVSAMFMPTGTLNPSDITLEDWETLFSRIGVASDFGDEWLSLSGIKLQIDGGMTLRTAGMRDGYPDDPDYHGTIVIEAERFNALVATVNRYGWRVGVHAVGDAAIDTVLDAFELADAENPIKDRRFIIIHGSLIQRDQMERARRLGVRVDAQSIFLWEKADVVARYLGKDVADRAFPMRTMIDTMGINSIAQGTDYPFNPINPFWNMSIMITRRDSRGDVYGANEAVTREEAIRLYTSAAARYAFAEKQTGSIEAGKLADMAVLTHDILSVPDDEIKSITVTRTIIGGKTVFQT